ncbi:MAG: PEP-CTERM sorting domain-containing protein [Thermoguttaceae bacterium]|jgi:hypothetical protein
MITRTKLILVCAGLLLAIAAATPSAGANLLVDPEFDGTPALNTLATVFGPPFITGQWGAENGAIVGVDGGVTPLTAKTMLAEYSPAGGYTQTIQVTDVSADPALSTYNLSAYFNADQHVSGAHAFVNITFYDSSNNLLGGPPSSGLILDGNTSTWEQISLTATEPLSTKYIVSQVMYDENFLLGTDGAIHPGYVDSASLTLVPEPGTIVLLLSGLVGLICYAWRKRK